MNFSTSSISFQSLMSTSISLSTATTPKQPNLRESSRRLNPALSGSSTDNNITTLISKTNKTSSATSSQTKLKNSSSSLFSFAATSSVSSFTNNLKQSRNSGHSIYQKPQTSNFRTTQRSYFLKSKYLSHSDVDLASRSSGSRAHSADSTYSAATTSYRLKTKGKYTT
jgi:hypothetical protein